MGQEALGEQGRKVRTAADPPDRVGQVAVNAVILQADQEKFLRRAGLLRCVQALSHHFPDLLIVLVVVAQVVKELPAKIVPNTDIASCSGAPSSVVSPIRRSRWTAVSSKGLWGRW